MSAIKASKVAVRYVVIALVCLPWLGSSAAAQGRWNGVVTELSGPTVCGGPAVGFDANGDGLAVWSTCGGIEWARFTRASGTWSGPQELSAASWAVPNLFVHARGHAILTWLVIDDSDFAVGAWASVYDADTATWTRAVEFSGDGRLAGGVVDNQGDAIVSWVESASAATVVKTAVYDGVAGVWTMAADIRVVGGLPSTVLRLDSNDQAIVLGQTSAGVTGVARFLPSIGAWSDPVALAGQGWPNMATDSVGNSTVVWTRVDGDVARVQASHYSASSGIWSAPVGLAISAPGARHIYRPEVASDAAGNTIAVWEWFDGVQWTVQSATYNASSHSWAAIASVMLGPNAAGFPSFPAVRFDPFGNATVVLSDPSASSVETARRSADGSWSTVTLAPSGAHSPTLAVDPAGNVAVAWASNSVIQTTRWEAAPAAPTITSATSSNGTLTVFATTPPAPPWFANTNYEYLPRRWSDVDNAFTGVDDVPAGDSGAGQQCHATTPSARRERRGPRALPPRPSRWCLDCCRPRISRRRFLATP